MPIIPLFLAFLPGTNLPHQIALRRASGCPVWIREAGVMQGYINDLERMKL